ncbi:hypothetical protein EJB05_31303, partial [Eragrostis curvula]
MAEILSKGRKQQQQEEEPLQLKQGSKVFSKLFSRESSAAAPSFRVYYGVASAGSVPFLWESQPGTPKNDAVSAAALPPLTPPPSYYTKQAVHHNHKPAAAAAAGAIAGGKKQCKHGFFSAILPKIILHRRSRSSGSPTSSACSSSSSSGSSASSLSFRSAQSPASSSMRSRVFAFSSVVGDGGDSSEEEQAQATCFSVRHESFRALKTCRVATTVKSALASVGGHHGTTAAQRIAPCEGQQGTHG